jgi:hypothetical protein
MHSILRLTLFAGAFTGAASLGAQSWELGLGLQSARPSQGNQYVSTDASGAEVRMQGPWVALPLSAGLRLHSWAWHRQAIEVWGFAQYGMSLGGNDYYQDASSIVNYQLYSQVVQGRARSSEGMAGVRLEIPLGSLGQYGKGAWMVGLAWKTTKVDLDGRSQVVTPEAITATPDFHASATKGEAVALVGVSSRQEYANHFMIQRLSLQVPLGGNGAGADPSAVHLEQVRPGAAIGFAIGIQFK